MRSRLRTVSGLLVGAFFIYWFVHSLNWLEVWEGVRTANWIALGLAMLLFIGTYVVRVLRWRGLLEPVARPRLDSLFCATVVGFFAQFLMGRAAEMIVRPAILSGRERVPPSASYATVMIERVFDMVMVVVFFAVNLMFFAYTARDAEAMRLFLWIKVTGGFLFLISAAGIYGLSIFRRRRQGALDYLDRKLSWLPGSVGGGLMSLLRSISEGLAVLHDAKKLSVTVSYTVLLWLMAAVAHLLVVRAFGIDYTVVPFTGAVFVMGLSMLGSVVPTPGGATGPFHTATATALTFLGVEHNKAASVAIVLHLIIFAPATLFGLFYIIKDGLSLRSLKEFPQNGTGKSPVADSTAVGAEPETLSAAANSRG